MSRIHHRLTSTEAVSISSSTVARVGTHSASLSSIYRKLLPPSTSTEHYSSFSFSLLCLWTAAHNRVVAWLGLCSPKRQAVKRTASHTSTSYIDFVLLQPIISCKASTTNHSHDDIDIRSTSRQGSLEIDSRTSNCLFITDHLIFVLATF